MTDFTTSVPQPTFGPTGVILPTEPQILTGVQADINTALGGGIDPGLTTPQGQLAVTETAVIGDSQATFAWYVSQVDPLTSSGRMQDALGRIYDLTRIPASATVQSCVCVGLDGTPIPVGTLAQDQSGNLWSAEAAGTIAGGTVTISFQSTATGPILGPSSMKPYTFVAGWESITPSGGATVGQDVETRAAFEARREATIAANSVGMLDSVLGAVLLVPGVLDAYAVSNDTTGQQDIGGVEVAANSIFVSVVGGTSSAVAFAIWSKKMPGCGTVGTTSVTVTDPNPQYAPPAPTYPTHFSFATNTAFAVLVTLKNNSGVPSNALSLVQTAIINAFAGLDGGSRAKIGSLILASRYYGDIIALGPWVEIISVTLGLSGAACSFTGAISGAVLTVSAISSGSLAGGQLVQDGSGLVANGTTIVAQLSGSPGSTGTYSVSIAQSVSSEAMTATALANDVQLNIDQAPTVAVTNIALALQ